MRSAAVALGLVAALALAEVAVRALDVGPGFQVLHRELFQLSDDPALGYELRPLAPDGEARINAAGFRDRDYARVKPPGTFRIVALGDSVTFGQPRRPDESWPHELERLLAERHPGRSIEVLNLGVTGYDAAQVAARLRVLGLAYEPDLVLYGYVLNDPQDLSIELEALRDLRDAAERRFHEDLGRGALRLLARSRLFLLVRSRFREPERAPVDFRHDRDPGFAAFEGGDVRGEYFRALHADPAGIAKVRAAFDRLAELLAPRGTPLVLVQFPLLLDPDAGPYPLSDVHALVADEARARGFDVLDLTEPLRECGRCAADILHPNARGARAAARAVASGLERLGRLGGTPPAAHSR